MNKFKKKSILIAGAMIVIFIIAIFIYPILFSNKEINVEGSVSSIESVFIEDIEVTVDLAITDEERTKGLSGRPYLEKNHGLLFVFPEKGMRSFWMPDMNFPIDIIWIDEGQVVGIDKEVSNDFNPDNPIYYTPPVPVKYVLEVNSGFADRKGIEVGDEVFFKAF